MLWTIFVILLVLWLLGLVTSYTMGGFIHVLLVDCRRRSHHPAPSRVGASSDAMSNDRTCGSDGRSEQRPDTRGHGHRERAPERRRAVRPSTTPAPPARAARPPSIARNTSDVPRRAGSAASPGPRL